MSSFSRDQGGRPSVKGGGTTSDRSSQASQTSISAESSSSGIFSGIQARFESSMLVACGVPVFSPGADRVVLPVLELASLVMLILYSLLGCEVGHADLPIQILRTVVDPLAFVEDITSFSVIFLIAFVYLVGGATLFFALVLSGTSTNDSLGVRLFVVYCRILRTVLLLPLANVMSDAWHSDMFETGSLEMHRISGFSLIDFPIFLYLVFGIVGYVVVVVLGSIDSLFLLDKFRIREHPNEIATAAPDGRFSFVVVLLRMFLLLVGSFVPPSYEYINSSVLIAFVFVVLLLHVRYTPYYSKWFSYVSSSLLAGSLGTGLAAIVIVTTQSYFGFFCLASIPLFVVLAVIGTTFRYYLLRRLLASSHDGEKDKGNIGTTLFVNAGPFDLSLMLSTLPMEQLRSRVLAVLADTSVTKSKELCHMLITLSLSESGVCASILNHARSIKRKAWAHNELSLAFYRDKIVQLRSSRLGRDLSSISDVRVQRQLAELRKREEKLRRLYQYVLGTVLSGMDDIEGGGGIRYVNFQQAMSEISGHRMYCEAQYARLMESYTTRNVLQRYAAFASVFLNDAELAERCRKEANSIHRIAPGAEVRLEGSQVTPGQSDCDDDTISVTSSISDGMSDPGDWKESEDGCKDTVEGASDIGSIGASVGAGTIVTVDSSARSSSRTLRSKMRVLRVWPALCLKWGLVLFVVSLVTVFVSLFSLTIFVDESFDQTAHNIDYLSVVRVESVSAAHFLRMLQVSSYDATKTPFEDERHTERFRTRTRETCDNVIQHAALVYQGVESIAHVWRETHLEMHERRLDDNGTMWSEYRYEMANYSLIDSIMELGEKCLAILELNKTDYAEREIGKRLEETDEFGFVLLNEPLIHHALDDLLEAFMKEQEAFSEAMKYVFIGVPLSLLLFIPYFLIGCCWYSITYAKSFKGFELVRKDHLMKLFARFEGKTQNIGSSRAQLPRFSTVQVFTAVVVAMIVISVGVLCAYAAMGVTSTSNFDVRNHEFAATCDLEVECRRLHLGSVELLYREDSFIGFKAAEKSFRKDMHELLEIFEHLRFGNVDHHLPGNDLEEYAHEFYYEPVCPSAARNGSLGTYEYLRCQTLARKVFLMITASEHLLTEVEEHELHGNHSLTEMRSLQEFRNVIELDNNEHDQGALQNELVSLGHEVQLHFQDLLALLNNVNILLLLVCLPVLVVTTLLCLCRGSSKLASDVRQTKELLVLLPRDVIMERTIYDYLRGRQSMKDLQKNRRNLGAQQLIDIMRKANYAMLWFGSDRQIVSSNEQAQEVLNIRASLARRLEDIFDEDTMRAISKWMKVSFSESYASFSGEGTAVYGDESFPVLLNIVRDKDTFLAIVEDVEGAKKKKILEETEKRTKETNDLLSNILPANIAKRIKLGHRNIVATHKAVTPWFADIEDFTGWSSKQSPEYIVNMLHLFFSKFDEITKKNGLEKIKTIGDCLCGVPDYKPKHASLAMKNAVEVWQAIRRFNEEHQTEFSLRQGLSSGNVVSGVIGTWKWCYDVWGSTINIAARMEQNCPTGKIMVSRSTYEIIYDKYTFVEKKVAIQGIGQVQGYIFTPSLDVPAKESSVEEELVIVDVDADSCSGGGEEEVVVGHEGEELGGVRIDDGGAADMKWQMEDEGLAKKMVGREGEELGGVRIDDDGGAADMKWQMENEGLAKKMVVEEEEGEVEQDGGKVVADLKDCLDEQPFGKLAE